MMKGNTMNSVLYRKKLAQAIALTSIVGFGLAACSDGDRSTSTDAGDPSTTNVEGSTSTATTGPGFDRVSDPTGSVTGLVQDTNGNPIEGASVYLAGQMASTDAGGVYFFQSVPAVLTTGMDDGLGGAPAGVLLVSIVPPSSYLGATVTVTPFAQIDGSPNDSAGVDSECTPGSRYWIVSAIVRVHQRAVGLPSVVCTIRF